MIVSIAYTDTCLPDYFGGDSRPWVTIYPAEKGYTSRELRAEILSEFEQGAVGGSDNIACDWISSEADQKRADEFFSLRLVACLNRDIKYRGKKHKYSEFELTENDLEECIDLPLLHIVFNIEEHNI